MQMTSCRTWPPFVLTLCVLLAALTLHVPAADAAAPTNVADAIAHQSGTATVRGYVVGQPTSSSTVVTSSYPSDTAIALADSPGETDTADMLYVQVPAAFRTSYGLKSNPSLRGKQIDVTGIRTAYFAHPGLKDGTAFTAAGGDPEEPPPTGDYDETYYADAIGKSGPALKTSLHGIIDENTTLSYAKVWDVLQDTDQDPNNSANVILLYTGRSQSKAAHGTGVDDWNREHVWAKSHGDFGTTIGAGTDVHHLRPTDMSVNSTRGNKDFDNGGTQVAEAPGSFTDSDSWEPRNAVKGDVARMIFYMAVRYEGGDGGPNLEMNNQVSNESNPYIGKESVLLQWNAQDPPDAFEQRRNDRIYEQWQHNRNPFVDHPEWAASIWN